MEFYCDWREQCLEVHGAYERFKVAAPAGRDLAFAAYDAAPAGRDLAFAAYDAALSREEGTCELDAEQIRRATARCSD